MSVAEPDVQRSSTFDRIFVEGATPTPRLSRPLPEGWRRAPLVDALRDMPAERRETVMAMGFGLLALVYGPLGIVALIVGRAGSFILLTLVLAAVIAAPRPPRPPWAQGPRGTVSHDR